MLALLGEQYDTDIASWIELNLRIPNLQQALATRILSAGPEELAHVMRTSKEQDVRRQAAAYLATLSGQRRTVVPAAVIKTYRFGVHTKAVPWQEGPLFVPANPGKKRRCARPGVRETVSDA